MGGITSNSTPKIGSGYDVVGPVLDVVEVSETDGHSQVERTAGE
jgi:hypothetical protein